MSYESKIHKELLDCKTQKDVDLAGATELDKINNWSTGVKGFFILGGFGILGYQVLKGNGYLPSSLPDIPHADKAGHFAKGFLTSAAVGYIHDRIDDWLERPKDADDIIRNRRKHIFERAVLEGSFTIAEAFTWEYLQMKWPPFPGSVFSVNDMLADFAGHIANWSVNAYYARKMVILYNGIMIRKKELHDSGIDTCEYEIPKPMTAVPITKPGRFLKSLDEYFGK